MERKPLTYEESHRLLKYHTHSLVKPSSYFHEPLQLPPEDLEPLPQKLKDEKAETPSSADQSPAGGKRRGQKRPRKPKGTATPPPNPNQMLQNQLNQAQLPINPQPHQQQMLQMQMSQQQMGNMIGNPNQGNMGGNMPMQMGNAQHMNQNIPYQQNPMQANQNQMMNTGGQMMPGQMMAQNQNMNFVGGNGPMGNQMAPQINQNQNPQQWGGNAYNNMPQNQQPNQQFYQGNMGGGMAAAGPGSKKQFIIEKLHLMNFF